MKSPAVIDARRRAYKAAVKVYLSVPREDKIAAYEKVRAASRALIAAQK